MKLCPLLNNERSAEALKEAGRELLEMAACWQDAVAEFPDAQRWAQEYGERGSLMIEASEAYYRY